MDLVIYGAQGMALGAYEAIERLYPERKPICFVVTKQEGNAGTLGGIPVEELSTFSASLSDEQKENTEILIATPENMMGEIEKSLEAECFFCHIRLTSDRWNQLVGCSHISDREFMPLAALPVGFHIARLDMYQAVHRADRKLSTKHDLPNWITPIQVGAALTGERVANVLDNQGENISGRNGNYSELTALYWIWKNRLEEPGQMQEECGASGNLSFVSDYCGLCHYRRVLDLSDDDILRLQDNNVDVVLPFPLPYEPDIEAHHKRYLSDSEWQAVLAALRELEPEYYKAAVGDGRKKGREGHGNIGENDYNPILKGKNLFNYNIILAKKPVLQDYCAWLFPLLFRVEEINDPDRKKAPNRYIGYIGETLETIYFMANRQRLNIRYAGVKFLT